MHAKRRYTWFLEPLSDLTNEAIAREVPEMNFNRDAFCADGKPRNLWECPYEVVLAFWNSKENLGLQFRIFVQEGRGKIRNGSFIFKRRKGKPTPQPASVQPVTNQ